MENDIELELSRLALSENAESDSPEEDPEEDYGRVTHCGEKEEVEEFPESVLSFLQFVKQRNESAEKLILQDLDSTDTGTSKYFPVQSKHQPSDDIEYLTQLASEYNEEPEIFRKRVLAEIEENDRKDLLSGDNAGLEIASVKKGDVENTDQLDGTGEVVNLCYIEVEESCRQKLQQWEKEQERHEDVNRAALSAHKAVLEKEIKEQDEKREQWKNEFEKELLKLNNLQQEQQEQLESDLKRRNEALQQDFKNYQNRIDKIEANLIIERNAFEEQKAKAKRHLEELQSKSAVKIQALFRAHRVHKMYAPVLMQKKEDRKRMEELHHKMEMEKKELEEKIKVKLEEKRRKDEEKKRNEEIARNKMEEAKRKEFLEQEMRQREYEKKKNEEKLRLEKAKLMKLEEKRKPETSSFAYSLKNWSQVEEGQQEKLNLILNTVEKVVKSSDKEENQDIHSKLQQKTDITMKGTNSERNTNVRISDLEPGDIKRESEIDTDGSPMVHDKNSKEIQKNIERESPSSMLTCMSITSPGEHAVSTVPAADHVEEQDTNQYVGNSTEETSHISEALNIGILSDQVEAKRLAWMKSCKPWFKILRDNQKVVIKKARQRKSSAVKLLPPLKEALILHNTPWQHLEQVTTVTLRDLPGCSLSTLSKCVKLKFLSLRRCGLTTLDGLSNCKALQYIDVQENSISIINCEGLENLRVLVLSRNQITSIHGIEDCEKLMDLELSFNLITRIAGLESLRNLQRLVLDHNQLVSTTALETTPLLTYLDCSYNYLTELEGIQNCGLLQILKLQGNNLSEIPRLDNHVLIRELYLDDNNLTTLTDMSSYWLPLLQVFSISQNSINHLAPFNTLISLEELNLSSNCLSDLATVSQWLEGCIHLRKLLIPKNPFLQEHNWSSTLQKTLPALRFLNDDEIKSEDKKIHTAPSGSFMALCQHQISNISKLWHVVTGEERISFSFDKLEIYCSALQEILQISNVYRYAHEYGDTDIAEREDPEILRDNESQLGLERRQLRSPIINSPPEDKNKDTKQITCQQTLYVHERSSTRANSREGRRNHPRQSEMSSGTEHSREAAAVLLQSHWRGYVIRRDIHYYTKLHEAASVIQTAWRHYYSRRKSLHKRCTNSKTSEVKQQAATVIQAAWKGFFLRKKLAAAFAGVDREELEDYFEEVNLDEFTFDENIFEKDWVVDPAVSHSRAPHVFTKPERPKMHVYEEGREYSLPWLPQEAWAASEFSALDREQRYEKDSLGSRSEKHNLSHVYSMKSNTDISFKSEKEEKISQEWGFKEASTAQLMLKRAQKMKSKQVKHKKMLDPAVRLALFKNNENKHAPVMPPKKARPAKIEYFAGKEEEPCQLKELPSEALARSRELTYQWLHTQYGDINTNRSAPSTCKRFLPELNHDILNGRRVQLVSNSPLSKESDDLELLSMKSGSSVSQNREEKVKTQRSSGTSSKRNLFAPVKTNSGPQRKERISFRDNPVQFSGGWGGGKKKGKANK